jgi:hypothetical protein
MKHCCEIMDNWLVEKHAQQTGSPVIRYSVNTRSYNFILHYDSLGSYLQFFYCPWCKTRLPEELGEKWCEVLKEELGIDDMDAQIYAKLPAEFKTDQWWKKRGLG